MLITCLLIFLGLGILGILLFVIGWVIYDMYQDRKLWLNKKYYKLFGKEFYPYNGKYVFGNNYMCKIRPSSLNRQIITCALANNTTIKVLVYCDCCGKSVEKGRKKDVTLRIRYFTTYKYKSQLEHKTSEGITASFIRNPKTINQLLGHNFIWYLDRFAEDCVYELNPKSIVGWKPEGKMSIIEFNKHICT